MHELICVYKYWYCMGSAVSYPILITKTLQLIIPLRWLRKKYSLHHRWNIKKTKFCISYVFSLVWCLQVRPSDSGLTQPLHHWQRIKVKWRWHQNEAEDEDDDAEREETAVQSWRGFQENAAYRKTIRIRICFQSYNRGDQIGWFLTSVTRKLNKILPTLLEKWPKISKIPTSNLNLKARNLHFKLLLKP